MQSDLNRVIEQVSKEKGMERGDIIEALESAMLSAARRTFGPKQIEAKFNQDIGEVELFEIKNVVETVTDADTEITLGDARATLDPEAQLGDELLRKLPSESLGRIAAQVAKQSVIQKVRELERDLIYNEFKPRINEICSGIVQRVERRNIIVNLGRTDAVLPEKEQIPWERYRQGDRVRAYIYDVNLAQKGPQIVLSRSHPGFLIKLFEQEVPEVYEGIVEIKGAAREPGSRAKIGVHSTDPDVDAAGACIGMKGTRVQSVVQELRGERIDIVPWTPDQAEYVRRAIKPAEVARITEVGDNTLEVIVPDDQLSLAIGKKGQNVRLAGRLTEWELKVRSESEVELERVQALAALNAIPGIGEAKADITAELLYQHGFKSSHDIAAAESDALLEIEGISAERADAIWQAAKEQADALTSALEAEQAEAAAAESATTAPAPDAAAGDEQAAAQNRPAGDGDPVPTEEG